LPDIFLSYSREDLSTARRFAEAFEREGLSVWWDQTLNPGEAFDEVTEKALNEAKAVVVLWSKKSVASRWVRAEATQANESKTLVPVMIEPCKRPIMFELTHTADLSHWTGDPQDPTWQSFAASVQRFTGGGVRRNEAPFVGSAPGVKAPHPGVRTVLSALAAVLLLGAGYWFLAMRHSQSPTKAGGAATVASTAVRLAVLPLEGLSQDPDQEVWSSGLADDLAIQLNQVAGLIVFGPDASRQFKGSNADLRVIAKTISVDHLLTGTVRRDGGQWRIVMKLIDGQDGAQRWSKAYQRENVSIFALQQEIATDVARAVGIALDVTLPRAQGGTNNVEAWELYMRAKELSNKNETSMMEEQAALLRKAVKLDPDYGMAWYGLFNRLRILISLSYSSPKAVAELRQERAQVGVFLGTMPPEGWMALNYRAWKAWEQHRWSEALSAAQASAAAAPTNYNANYTAAMILDGMGRIGDAIPYLRRTVEADPLSSGPSGGLVTDLKAVGRVAEAEAESERFRMASGTANLAFPGDWESVKTQLKRELRPDGRIARPPFAGERPGILDDMVAMRAALRRSWETHSGAPVGIFYLAGLLGDVDLMYTMASSIVDLPEAVAVTGSVWTFPVPEVGQRFRADPRFKQLVRGLGLVDYFRASGNWGDFCKPVGKDDFECH
jgi:TolB-like protein